MKRIVLSMAIIGAFFIGSCCRPCVKNDDQAQKSKIEAEKALDELDKEKSKENQ